MCRQPEPSLIASCTTPHRSPLPAGAIGSKTRCPQQWRKLRKAGSPTNLQPPGPRAKAGSAARLVLTRCRTSLELNHETAMNLPPQGWLVLTRNLVAGSDAQNDSEAG